MKKTNPFLVIAAFVISFSSPVFINAQEDEEDEKKLIREVIFVEVDRPAAPAAPVVEENHGKKGKKKHQEEPPPEETVVDSGGTIPAPPEELKKRGSHWMNKKDKSFSKSEPMISGTTLECIVSFPYKPKELNPGAPVDGKITMKVVIDCKEGKYRYTIKEIKHAANKEEFSGGDVYENVPVCGSLFLPDPQWKRIKSFALLKANEVANNLKESMNQPVKVKKDDW